MDDQGDASEAKRVPVEAIYHKPDEPLDETGLYSRATHPFKLPAQSPSQLRLVLEMDDQLKEEVEQVEEDGRLDYLLRMQNTMKETFDNPVWLHPHGMTDFDHCIIPPCRQKAVDKLKMNIRRQNALYIHQHPELDALMSIFIKKLLKAQPKDAVRFATEFFAHRRMPRDELQHLVNEELSKLKQYQNPKGWRSSLPSYTDNKTFADVNEVKTLTLGPTQEFGFTPPPSPPKPRHRKVKKQKPKPHVYCGCKDPGRRETVPKEKLTEDKCKLKTSVPIPTGAH